MNNQELIRMALLNLKRRKVRTFLAVAGVIIGTAAIVVMMSLGIGLSQSFTDQIKSMGNLHVIDIYPKGGGTVPGKNGEGILNKKNVATIGKIPGVSAITPIEEFYVRMSVGKFVGSVNLIGMDPEMMSKFGYKAAAGGRILQGGDKFNLAFGQDSPGNFMDSRNQKYVYKDESGQYPMNLMGDKIVVTVDQDYMTKKQPGGEDNSIPKAKYPEYKMKSVGIIDDANYSTAYSIFTSLEAVEKIKAEAKRAELAAGIKTYGTQTGYSSAKVYVDDIDKVAEVNDAIKGMEFYTNTLMEALNEMKKTAAMIQGILGGIGAVSLIVAALGITNTMIMSIYERTREIGVMKVLGARLLDIRNLFLFEAAIIGLLGGLLGNALSLILSFATNKITSAMGLGMNLGMGEATTKLSVIPWWLVLASLVFSTLIGVVSGYYPAKRAMNLSALESIRNE